jgi:hypothetical protein
MTEELSPFEESHKEKHLLLSRGYGYGFTWSVLEALQHEAKEAGPERCIRCHGEIPSFNPPAQKDDLRISVAYLFHIAETERMDVSFATCTDCAVDLADSLRKFLGYRVRQTSKESKERVPERLRWKVFRRDNMSCNRCGRNATAEDIVLRVHHLDPERGHTLENLVTMCDFCHP